MRTKILLYAMLGSMGLTVYPVTVQVRNLTNGRVFVNRFRVPPYETTKISDFLRAPSQFTFVRVKGYKKVKGTVFELKEIVDDLAKRYGRWSIHDKYTKKGGLEFWLSRGLLKAANKIVYLDAWSDFSTGGLYKKEKKYSIPIPELETFTIKHPTTRDTVIEIKSWGKEGVTFN